MIARARFHVGDRVTFSAVGHERLGSLRKAYTGVVVGFTRDPEIVRIQRKDYKHPESFHESFWQVIALDCECGHAVGAHMDTLHARGCRFCACERTNFGE